MVLDRDVIEFLNWFECFALILPSQAMDLSTCLSSQCHSQVTTGTFHFLSSIYSLLFIFLALFLPWGVHYWSPEKLLVSYVLNLCTAALLRSSDPVIFPGILKFSCS